MYISTCRFSRVVLFDVSYIQQEVVVDDFFLLFKLFGKDTELSNLCVRIALSIYLFHPISLMLRIRRLRNGWRGWSGASIWACLSCSLPRLCMAGPQNQSCRKRRKGCMNMSPNMYSFNITQLYHNSWRYILSISYWSFWARRSFFQKSTSIGLAFLAFKMFWVPFWGGNLEWFSSSM